MVCPGPECKLDFPTDIIEPNTLEVLGLMISNVKLSDFLYLRHPESFKIVGEAFRLRFLGLKSASHVKREYENYVIGCSGYQFPYKQAPD